MSPAELPYVSAKELQDYFGTTFYERGRSYANKGMVGQASWDPQAMTLRADVSGTAAHDYISTVRLQRHSPTAKSFTVLSSRCTCPVGRDCKHVVAALMAVSIRQVAPFGSTALHDPDQRRSPDDADWQTARSGTAPRGWAPDGSNASSHESREPDWKSILSGFSSDRVDDSVWASGPGGTLAGSAPTRLALGFEICQLRRTGFGNFETHPIRRPKFTGRSDLVVTLRPLMEGARGNWIKGDVSWSNIANTSNTRAYAHGQAAWFAQLYGLSAIGSKHLITNDDSVVLDWFTSPLLWHLFDQAKSLGIELVGTSSGLSIHFREEGSTECDVVAISGGLETRSRITIDDESFDQGFCGPIDDHGFYGISTTGGFSLVLAPAETRTDRDVVQMLRRWEPVTITDGQTRDFFTDFYPKLAYATTVVSSDDSVTLPVLAPPDLALTITYGGQGAHLTWEWHYHHPVQTFPVRRGALVDRNRSLEHEDGVLVKLSSTVAATPLPLTLPSEVRRADTVDLDGLQTAVFVDKLLPNLSDIDQLEVLEVGHRPDYREVTDAPLVSMSTEEAEDSDWFDIRFHVTIDGQQVRFADLFVALAQGAAMMVLPDGTYFSLDGPFFDKFRRMLADSDVIADWQPESPRLSRYHMDLWAEFDEVVDESAAAASWRRSVETLSHLGEIPALDVPEGIEATLRPYQLEGFSWLVALWSSGLGGILADDMGLGKTLQALSLFTHVKNTDDNAAPILVVAPTSVMSTWRAEAEKFAPGLRVATISATEKKRKTTLAEEIEDADLVITSYAILRLDARAFRSIVWDTFVLDEAQFVKNRTAKVHAAAKTIQARFRLAITGTPMENSLTDLWSLCSITSPGLLPGIEKFRREIVSPIESGESPEGMALLRRQIRPFMKRRNKELVAADLPPKQEQILRVELSTKHRDLYNTVLQKERKKLLGLINDMDRNRFAIFRSLTLLRMLAIDPYLIDEKYEAIGSSKLSALFSHLDDIVAEGHRTIIFSQFTSFLTRVGEQLDHRDINYCYLDGSTRNRGAVIDDFRTGDAPVFLISLKAGGFGLTLTEADYVFLLDPWWNPAVEAQAVDRAHRIGQTKNVMVYRMVSEKTIEEKVLALQERKAQLFDSLVNEGEGFASAITGEDIRGLLDG
ncbi:DEAD/DEAH box helicase [Brevibacterium antiquum]|uniref:SWIM zinc finger n=1 Tax=Brevibacterium antiquum TaxID=234835 RepID=A0A2H1KR73_9MICO|nr:DEAD/DEAH box helicase [Brevibacterium antiquum]SMY02149.1 SWIM zinc finger [Brevibacterium antiquum]